MRLTIIGELAAMEGRRVIQKEVRVYTDNVDAYDETGALRQGQEERIYHPTKQIIEKLLGKTFQGEEYTTHVEINLNQIEEWNTV
jgi:hypothetical protein